MQNFIKVGAHCNFETKPAQVLILGQDPQFSNIIFKINQLDLLWVSNFIALGIYFIFGTNISLNEGIDTCFHVECVLLARNFDFFGRYLVVTDRYLVVIDPYCSLHGGYLSLLLVPTFSMNVLRDI